MYNPINSLLSSQTSLVTKGRRIAAKVPWCACSLSQNLQSDLSGYGRGTLIRALRAVAGLTFRRREAAPRGFVLRDDRVARAGLF